MTETAIIIVATVTNLWWQAAAQDVVITSTLAESCALPPFAAIAFVWVVLNLLRLLCFVFRARTAYGRMTS